MNSSDNGTLIKLTFAILFALLGPNNRATKPKRMASWFKIFQIIRNKTNNNVALAPKTHSYIIIKSLYLIDNMVLHTMIAIMCLNFTYFTLQTCFKFNFNLMSYNSYEIAFSYFILDFFSKWTRKQALKCNSISYRIISSERLSHVII